MLKRASAASNLGHRSSGVAATRHRPVRLCLISHKHLSLLAAPLLHEFEGRAEIEIFDETFEPALEIALQRERLGLVDAFVSAGGNAAVLRGAVKSPVAAITIGGFDLLAALIEARAVSHRVGVISFDRVVHELEAVKALLNIEIEQRTYRTRAEADNATRSLQEAGVSVIVGSSVVVESAQRAGLTAILGYSPSGIRLGIEDGIEMARVSRLESARAERIGGVLRSLQEAVLAVDHFDKVIAVNPPMEALLGSAEATLIGRELHHFAPELDLRLALEDGGVTTNEVLQFARREWIAHRAPISEQGVIVGATLTLYDAKTIQEADTSLRTQRKGRSAPPAARHRFADVEGSSTALRDAITTAERYARSHLTVLITGETGTGKEVFAQAIHNASPRADKPFIAVNCAAFPETLLESELFGYEEGAFTGARRGGKHGLFEAAHTGTLLLDEIGDMPLPLQSRLLRVLQEREVVRLGGLAPIPVDVRIIAATHQPLRQLVSERRFREDLFYRINLLQVTLPPLRERPGDILPLARRFVARCLKRLGCRMDAEALLAPLSQHLVGYAWQGNVRELENICERLAMYFSQFTEPSQVRYAALAVDCSELFSAMPGQDVPMAQQLHDALAVAKGNRREAARLLGISRATLWRRMQEASRETRESDS